LGQRYLINIACWPRSFDRLRDWNQPVPVPGDGGHCDTAMRSYTTLPISLAMSQQIASTNCSLLIGPSTLQAAWRSTTKTKYWQPSQCHRSCLVRIIFERNMDVADHANTITNTPRRKTPPELTMQRFHRRISWSGEGTLSQSEHIC
jgi:hypothetical protein